MFQALFDENGFVIFRTNPHETQSHTGFDDKSRSDFQNK